MVKCFNVLSDNPIQQNYLRSQNESMNLPETRSNGSRNLAMLVRWIGEAFDFIE